MDKIPKKNKVINKKINILRKKFKKFNIDGYVIPKNDEFFSEYAIKDRLKIISNFNGSAGLAIILKKKIIYLSMEDTQSKHNNNQENNLK
jgi:Xaa-Pro aminopeptidase